MGNIPTGLIARITRVAAILCGREPAQGASMLDIVSFQADDGLPLNALYAPQTPTKAPAIPQWIGLGNATTIVHG
jgi:hypothetical protein